MDEADSKIFGSRGTSGTGGTAKPKDSAAAQSSIPLLEYSMNGRQRGVCILINQKLFDFAKTGQNTRDGTDVDANKIEVTFKRLGYDVRRFSNLKGQEILSVLYAVSQENHTERDSFVCVVLSHGIEGRIYGYDTTVSTDTMLRYFRGDKCASLVGKPKFFIFQACRGTRFDQGVEVEQTDSMKRDASGDEISTKLPIEADFLLAYSTVPGYYSWRNNQDGSWFIQSLCRVLREHAPLGVELMHMMVTVNRLVATSYESCTDQEWTDGMKQMPSIVCMLTKQLYFKSER